MERSVSYNCTKPFEHRDNWLPVWAEGVCFVDDFEVFAGTTCTKLSDNPDDWLPIWLDGFCALNDPEIFAGKTKAEIFSMPLVHEPDYHWQDTQPIQIASLGSFTTPRTDKPAVWAVHPAPPWNGSTVTRPPEHVPEIPPIPPIPLPAGGLMLITALAALRMMKGDDNG